VSFQFFHICDDLEHPRKVPIHNGNHVGRRVCLVQLYGQPQKSWLPRNIEENFWEVESSVRDFGTGAECKKRFIADAGLHPQIPSAKMRTVRLNMRSYSLQSGSCELLHSDILYVPFGHLEVKDMLKVWLNPIQFCQPSEYIDALQTLRWIEVEMVRSTWSYGIRFKSGLPFPTNLVCSVCLLKVWKYPNNSHHAHTFLYPLLRKRQPHELTLVFRSLLCARVCWHTTKLSGIATSRQTLVGPQAAQVRPAVESWSETDCRFPGMKTYNLRPFTFMSHSWEWGALGKLNSANKFLLQWLAAGRTK